MIPNRTPATSSGEAATASRTQGDTGSISAVGRGRIAFDKYEGLGNDFIVIEAGVIEAAAPDALALGEIAALCDRRFGVGADGVLLVSPPPGPGVDAAMRVVNADGSIPEMCGNGVRCVALHVARARALEAGTLRIATDAGTRECALTPLPGVRDAATVTVDMGIVRVLGEQAIEVDGERIVATTADAGNPHAVLFGEFRDDRVRALGARLAVHPAFPNGTNVEFAHAGATGIDVVVWERGVGLTLACGTGACATAAVACAKGLAAVGVPVVVRLPGGALEVTIAADGHATMRGPARHVYAGTVARDSSSTTARG